MYVHVYLLIIAIFSLHLAAIFIFHSYVHYFVTVNIIHYMFELCV